MGRCLISLKQRGVDVSTLEPNEITEDDYDLEQAITISSKYFSTGDLWYEDRWSNGGGYSIGYDIETKRAYFSWSHH